MYSIYFSHLKKDKEVDILVKRSDRSSTIRDKGGVGVSILFFISGFIGIFVSVILLFVDFLRRRPLKYKWISLALSIALIALAFLSIDPDARQARTAQTAPRYDPALLTLHQDAEEQTDKEILVLENQIRAITHRAFGPLNGFDGKDSIIQLNYDQEEKFVSITVFGKNGLTKNLIKRTMWRDAHEVLKKLAVVNEVDSVSFHIVLPAPTNDGGAMYTTVMKMDFEKDTFASIDWAEFTFDKMPQMADDYWTHQTLQ